MPAQVLRRRFTVDEYYRMAEAGILHEDDRVELIEGEIVEIAPIGSRHAACVKRLDSLLSQAVGPSLLVSVQDPIHLNDNTEPQPDVTLLRPRADFYASAHPGPEDILLVVEVADRSAEYDRETKVPLYARNGIREAWVVDLLQGVVEVYRSPSNEGYRESRRLRRGDRIALEAFPGLEISVDEVMLSGG